MLYTVHGGHAKQGNKYCGASGYCNESEVDRLIKDAVIKWLELDGNVAYDCTVDSGFSQSNIINKIKSKINSYKGATANISIHLNACSKSTSDGKTKGVEVCVYATGTAASKMGIAVCKAVNVLGYTNRGVKIRTDLGVLKGITNGGANLLVEVFFCDDQDDFILYKALGADKLGKAIAEGVVGHTISEGYMYNGVDYSPVFNSAYYAEKYADLRNAFGLDTSKLFKHFCQYGMNEKRQAIADFNVDTYKNRYKDLQNAFGNNYMAYYTHYCVYGKKEGRKGI